MKKRAIALILSAVCLSGMFAGCSMLGLGGDDGDGAVVNGGAEVSTKQWKEMLSMDYAAQDNFTFIQSTGSTYGKEEAEEYGEWYYYVMTYKIDRDNDIYIYHNVSDRYVPEEEKLVDGESVTVEAHFEEEETTEYYFKDGNTYYCVQDYNYEYDSVREDYEKAKADGSFTGTFKGYCTQHNIEDYKTQPWRAYEITKANYIEETETMMNLAETLSLTNSAYAELKSMFKYNESTGRYQLIAAGTMAMELKFIGTRGVEYYMETNSITYISQIVQDFGATETEIPKEAYDVLSYATERNW